MDAVLMAALLLAMALVWAYAEGEQRSKAVRVQTNALTEVAR